MNLNVILAVFCLFHSTYSLLLRPFLFGKKKKKLVPGRRVTRLSELSLKAETNIEIQFSKPGTAEQGLDRGWLSRDTNMQIGIYGSSELDRNASKIGSSSLREPVTPTSDAKGR